MRRSGRLLILVGVVMGVAALILAIVAIAGGGDEGDEGDTGPTEPTEITVVVAKEDIPAHTQLKSEDLEEETVPRNSVPNPDDVVQSINEAVGFAYSVDLQQDQRLLRSQLEVTGVAEQLEPGRRAISVPVDQNNLVAGLVRQDDSIDLIYELNVQLLRVTPTTPLEVSDELELQLDSVVVPPFGEQPDPAPYPYPGEPGSRFVITDQDAGNPVAKVVLQNLRVLRVIEASATEGGATGNDENYLVLDVAPNQAELIAMMTTAGRFHVVLRNPDDDEEVATPGVNMELLVTQYNLPVPKTVRLPGPGAQ